MRMRFYRKNIKIETSLNEVAKYESSLKAEVA